MDRGSSKDDFLGSLPPRVRMLVLSGAESFHHLAGETIFREGDPSLFLYVVKSGRVALDIAIGSKQRLTLTIVEAGGAFSWSALSQSRLETASARALEETELLGVNGEMLRGLCENPEVGIEIYRNLTEVIAARLAMMREALHALPERVNSSSSNLAA